MLSTKFASSDHSSSGTHHDSLYWLNLNLKPVFEEVGANAPVGKNMPTPIGRQMAGCGKKVWDCWKFRFRWNLRVFIPPLLRVTTTHSIDRISIWNLYLLAWTLFSSWYKYANPSLIGPQMAACGNREWNFQKSRLRQNLHILITHLLRVTTTLFIYWISLRNLFLKTWEQMLQLV